MIYLDYSATSPPRPEVVETLLTFLGDTYGNPSSLHAKGRQAREAVERVRREILSVLGDPGGGLLFTSGGTEADNLAVKGVMRASKGKKRHLIVSSIEHHAVLHPAVALAEEGMEVSFLPVDGEGKVDVGSLRKAIRPDTGLISVMHANNEVGTLQPIAELGAVAREHQIPFHVDAIQSFGKMPLSPKAMGADLVSLSSHKLGGLKGTGALYFRRGLSVEPLLHGGPHERNLRAGTENVPGIAGLGAALQAALRDGEGAWDLSRRLRDRLEEGLKERIPDFHVNGHPTERLPGTLHVSFLGCEGETLLMALDLAGICVSTGSACSSGSIEPSHVLSAMGLSGERIRGSVRFSLGWGTTEDQIEECLRVIPKIVERVRKSSPCPR